jgi:DNA-binding NarL/FixJ family response regulator
MDSIGNATCVVIADHPAASDGLGALLDHEGDIEVVARTGDGLEAVCLFQIRRPERASAPAIGGPAAAGARREFPQALIVALMSEDSGLARALAIGVRAYIRKKSRETHAAGAAADARGLITDVREADRSSANRSSSQPVPFPRNRLTSREISVVEHVAQGRSNRDIGRLLHVSEHAIKARIKSILGKLGANDRTHAVTLARERGFLDS